MGDRAGIWLRVSTGQQDEENQAPDCLGWAASHDYEVARTYTLHGKSASKGEQQKYLDQVIEDMTRGIITVLVVWKDDRLERRGLFHMTDFVKQVTEAGGRIEFVTQPMLNDLTTLAGRVSLTIMSEMAREEAKTKSDRTRMTRARIADEGGFLGRAPWGFEISGEKYRKVLRATDVGIRVIPEMFRRVRDGESLSQVAAWMETETGRKWWPRTIGTMIRNDVYRTEGLVDATTFRRAGERLDSKPKRGPMNLENQALLAGLLRCGECARHGIDSPMYRVNKGQNGIGWYRCTGRGPARHGCGNMIACSTVDAVVGICMRKNTKEIVDWVLVPGENHDEEIDSVKLDLRRLDPDADDYDERHAALRAELARLKSLPRTPDGFQERSTGETYADKWRRLNTSERRSWLRERGIRVRAAKDRLVVLDSHGYEIYEWKRTEARIYEEA